MGRTRAFDETVVLDAAADAFVRGGYEATSIDDLVTALGIHRGSLYNTFGSKRGLFLRALDRHIDRTLAPLVALDSDADAVSEGLVKGAALDLILVAALERGREDAQVASAVRSALALVGQAVGDVDADPPVRAVELLGARLYARLTP